MTLSGTRAPDASRALSALIVDDEEPVRKFVERVLREAGYQTALAPTAPKRSRWPRSSTTFDVLVTDVMMPQMTGDELARRLRQTEPALKVLYLTGFSDRLFKEKVTLWAGRGVSRQAVQREGPAARRCRCCCSATSTCPQDAADLSSRFTADELRLAAARVHLEVRILLQQILHRHERAAIAEREALFGAAVVARPPAAGDQRRRAHRRVAPRAQRRAQIDAARRVEAQVPHAVGRQPAAVAACGRTARSSTR